MDRIPLARAAVAALASLLLTGLPLGGSAAAARDHECDGARCSPPGMVLKGYNNGARDDRLSARAINNTAGAEVRLFRREASEWIEVADGVMNDKGNRRFVVEDLNGRSWTKYLVRVSATEDTHRTRATKKVR